MKKISTPSQEFSYGKDKILRIKLFENSEIKLKDAEDGIEIANQLTRGERHFVLVDMRSNAKITAEAKKFIETQKVNRNRIAEAFLVSSIAVKISQNLYFSVNLPTTPTKVFLNETDALAWFDDLIYLAEKDGSIK